MPQAPARRPRSTETEPIERAPAGEDQIEDEDLVALTDDLLDEIDSVLEDQEVLVAYRQKSGQ